MVIFKFGGASVKSPEAVRNIVDILGRYDNEEIVVVVSAMGKTTNALERIIESYTEGDSEVLEKEIGNLKSYHMECGGFTLPGHGTTTVQTSDT